MSKKAQLRAIMDRACGTGRLPLPKDWTVKDGVWNSSDKFIQLTGEVESVIKNSAWDLFDGNTHLVAVRIVAWLAHIHGMKPTAVRRRRKTSLKKGSHA